MHLISERTLPALTVTLTKWILWGTLLGAAVGSTSSFLIFVNDWVTETRERTVWLVYLLPIGGAFIGALYRYFGNGSRAGNDLILEYIHEGDKRVPYQMGPIVFIGTFVTNLLGGSTGREGAAIQMAGSIAETVNRVFKIGEVDRRILLIAAISGGFGSAFGTPIAGTVFGMEVVSVGRMRYDAVVPCAVASIIGHMTASAWGVEHEHFIIQHIPEFTWWTTAKIVAAALAFCFSSILYCQLRHGVYHFCRKHIPNLIVRGFIGGAVIVGLFLITGTRDYLGRGLPLIEKSFEDTVPALAFLAKIIFTAVTMGTGFRGGEAIPMFFVGSTLGNALSSLLDMPASFLAALGLIGVFCGASQAPISCFLLSVEMFEGKGTLFFFIVCLISYLFSGTHSIYPTQTLHEPKSRMLNHPEGLTIAALEKQKRKAKGEER